MNADENRMFYRRLSTFIGGHLILSQHLRERERC